MNYKEQRSHRYDESRGHGDAFSALKLQIKRIIMSDDRTECGIYHVQITVFRSIFPEKKICDAILNKEHINLKSGLVRYGNGVAMDTKAIMELAGISNRRTTQTALKGLIEKGVLRREVNNNKSVYYVSRHRYKIDTQLLALCHHQLPSILAGSWGLFYDDHPILNTNTG